MKRNLIGVLCCFMMVVLIGMMGATQATSEEICIDSGTVTLKAPQDVEAERGAVEFPHGAHFDYKCKECHHTWNGETEVSGCMTSGCHDSSTSLLKTDPDQAHRYYKNAYHDMCISCHKKITAANRKLEMSRKNIDGALPKTGPTGCIGCHPKH